MLWLRWWLVFSFERRRVVSAETTRLVAEVRAALGAGEGALQQNAWGEALGAYEKALETMRSNSLSVNEAAETQLYNNAGWAAFHLGDYERALSLYGLGARSCEIALVKGLFEGSHCIDKIYENLHELLHNSMGRREEAMKWMRHGIEASERVAEKLGLSGERKLAMGMVVSVRLGYCHVLEHQYSQAEELLMPLISRNRSREWQTDAFRRPLIQESATYLGWAKKLARDWIGASRAFATAARLALPVDDESCAWRVQEGWLEDEDDDDDVNVWPMPTYAPSDPTPSVGDDQKAPSAPLPPWCIARGKRASSSCSASTDALDGWTIHRGRKTREMVPVKLVEVKNLFVSGEDGSAMWKPFPQCVFYSGDHTASSSLPTDWGVEAVMAESEGMRTVSSPREDTDSLVRNPQSRAEEGGVAVLLFDMRDGHKMFWHYQTETMTRLSIVLARLFDRDASPAADLPASVREKLKGAKIVYPQTLGSTIVALLKRRHRTLLALNEMNRLEVYRWRPGKVHHFDSAFVVDWPPAEPRPAFTKVDGFREYSESLFRLHFVPAPLLALQAALLRQAFPPSQEIRKPYALFYSRADTDKRHFVSETGLMSRMKNSLESLQTVAWRGDAPPDVVKAAREWSRAAVVVGPHGGGLANLVHCAPGTPVIVFPLSDAVGTPSSSDEYIEHLAKALDLRLIFLVLDQVGPVLSPGGVRLKARHAGLFGNYSEVPERDQYALVEVVKISLLAPDKIGKLKDVFSTTTRTFKVGEHPLPQLTLYQYY